MCVHAFVSSNLQYKQFFIEIVPISDDDDTEKFSFEDSLQYDFEIIRSATDDFSDANKLGQGGFGAVYKVIIAS